MKKQKRKRLTITDVYEGLMDLKAAVELGFTKMEERFEARITQSEKATWRRLDAHGDRFDVIDHRFDAMDKRFDVTDARFDAMDVRFDRLEDRVGSLELRPAR